MLLEKSGEISPEGMNKLSQNRNTQLWMCLVVNVKLDVIKNNMALESGMLRSMNHGKLEVVK